MVTFLSDYNDSQRLAGIYLPSCTRFLQNIRLSLSVLSASPVDTVHEHLNLSEFTILRGLSHKYLYDIGIIIQSS